MNKYQIKKKEEIKKQVIALHKQGLTTRNIGEIFGKSHTWAWDIVKHLSTVSSSTILDKTLQT